jgi:hypothetical protein
VIHGVVGAALFPLLLAANGCSTGCGDVAYPDMATLHIVPQGGVASKTDEWTITVDYGASHAVIACREETAECTTKKGDEHAFAEDDGSFTIVLGGTPASATVRVELRGAVIADGAVAFAYSSSEPDGRGCGHVSRGEATVVADRTLAPSPS